MSALHIPSFQESTLISGGGDPVLKVWDWMSGKLLADIPVFDVAEPYIKAKAPKRKRGWSDEDGEGEGAEGGEPQKQKGKGKGRGRRARGKGKGKGKEIAEAEEEQGDRPMAEVGTGTSVEERGEDVTPASSEDTVLVFAVHKIRSVDRGEHGRFIVFSVVGWAPLRYLLGHESLTIRRASALFYTPFPERSTSPSSAILAIEFPVPVIDFTVGPNGDVWTLLDAEWAGAHTSSPEPRFARLLSWHGSTVRPSLPFPLPGLA